MESKGHDGRDDLVGEHPWGDAVQVVLLVTFLAVWIVDSFFLGYTTFPTAHLPLPARIVLSLAVLATATYLARSGLRTVFGPVREKPEVIRDGVFGLVRHPIYLSAILFYLGLLLFTISLAAAGIWAIAVVFYRYIAGYEEKLLVQAFGADYEEYMRDVPMLLPRLRRR